MALPALTRPTGHGTAPAARRQPQALALSSLLLASCRAPPQGTVQRCRAQNGSAGQPQRRLLVAVEDTQESFNTVKWALENVYRPGDVLHFLHVLPKRDSTHSHVPMRGADLGSMGSMDFEDDLETYAQGFLTKTMVRLAHRHNADCEVDLIKVKGREPVGTSICKHAEKLEASMVIVSAHQRSFIEEVFFESVSKHVVQHCKQPTVVVPLQRVAAKPAQPQAAPQRTQQQQQQLQAAPAAVQATQHNLAR